MLVKCVSRCILESPQCKRSDYAIHGCPQDRKSLASLEDGLVTPFSFTKESTFSNRSSASVARSQTRCKGCNLATNLVRVIRRVRAMFL